MSRESVTPLNAPARSAAPAVPTLRAGDLYYDTATSKLRVYSGSAWADVAAAGSGYATVQDGGTPVTARSILNFVDGAGVTVTVADNAGATRTDVTIAAAVTSVAARTGAVTLTAADVAAGTFPAGAYVIPTASSLTLSGTSALIFGGPGRILGESAAGATFTGSSAGDLVMRGPGGQSVRIGVPTAVGAVLTATLEVNEGAVNVWANTAATSGAPSNDSSALQLFSTRWTGSAAAFEGATLRADRASSTAGDWVLTVAGATQVTGHATAPAGRAALRVVNGAAGNDVQEWYSAAAAEVASLSNGGAMTATDFLVGAGSLPRGVVRRVEGTADVTLSTTLGSEVTVLTAAAYTFVSGRRYRVKFKGRVVPGTVHTGNNFRFKIFSGGSTLLAASNVDAGQVISGASGSRTVDVENSVNNLSGSLVITVVATHATGSAAVAATVGKGNDNNFFLEVEDMGTAA